GLGVDLVDVALAVAIEIMVIVDIIVAILPGQIVGVVAGRQRLADTELAAERTDDRLDNAGVGVDLIDVAAVIAIQPVVIVLVEAAILERQIVGIVAARHQLADIEQARQQTDDGFDQARTSIDLVDRVHVVVVAIIIVGIVVIIVAITDRHIVISIRGGQLLADQIDDIRLLPAVILRLEKQHQVAGALAPQPVLIGPPFHARPPPLLLAKLRSPPPAPG